MNIIRSTPRYIIIKMAKLNIKNLKSSKGKAICYIQRNSLKTMIVFSAETLLARGSRMIKVLKLKTKILYLAKLSFTLELKER